VIRPFTEDRGHAPVPAFASCLSLGYDYEDWRKLGSEARLDLHAGASTQDKLTVKDSDGNEIAHDDFGFGPIVAATLSARF
jgi:hypothetical protein